MISSIYITGDCHGNFNEILYAIDNGFLLKNDTIIILGDSGLNYNYPSKSLKNKLSRTGINYFIIHGNHDGYRPNRLSSYKKIDYNNGKAYVEEKYPNIVYAEFGEVYSFNVNNTNKKCLVLDGAYSVDKYYRLDKGYGWWEDEQPTENMKESFEKKLKDLSDIDFIFTHTCPYDFEPRHLFLNCVDQNNVDDTYEKWLQIEVYNKLKFNDLWYCGHFHNDEMLSDNMVMLYHKILKLGESLE